MHALGHVGLIQSQRL